MLASVVLVVKQLGSNRRSNACHVSSRNRAGLGTFVGVAQPVELQFCKLEVRGSSPLASSAAASRFDVTTNDSLEGCPSGQWERAVNPPAYAYGGSNPPPSTSPSICLRARKVGRDLGFRASRHWCWRAVRVSAIARVPAAGVAQLVERQPSKLNVVGSNPISRSNALSLEMR
jgi:hypothetical protein